MADKKGTSNHLIGDEGIYVDSKPRHVTAFIIMCRIMTVILIILGAAALISGNM